ncbi:efflux RND transporter periplasmic adaptor subunit [Massilia arenae]|uniref:Efflux RND transporter periplasmic adaptor subunit n=2 Tax=Massilia arenae TaxID=2603288 RepID=A0A5C7FTT2_9BURK|nr:efflux RND transporter periplasmic adaptor subunit [Massilia arenae]
MKTSRKLALVAATALAGAAFVAVLSPANDASSAVTDATRGPGQPALAVAVTTLSQLTIPTRIAASGNIQPWQEASIGAEANGLRLVEVKVNVGDRVRRGQLLARFAAETVEAELAQARAALAEAEVMLGEAAGNARRARLLAESGAMAAQQIEQQVSAERAAGARLEAARAVLATQSLRLAQTRIVAPDDGIVSLRAATVGAVASAGQELFRLIRGGRLEWRAEVAGRDLDLLRPGQRVTIALAGGQHIAGELRMLAPAIDLQTRNGMAYVDLAPHPAARAGMFARGEFDLGERAAETLPQSATLLREGFSYVMRVGDDSRVEQTRVSLGRRSGDRVEILQGIKAQDRVVAAGVAFLGDGDLVHVTSDTDNIDANKQASR